MLMIESHDYNQSKSRNMDPSLMGPVIQHKRPQTQYQSRSPNRRILGDQNKPVDM